MVDRLCRRPSNTRWIDEYIQTYIHTYLHTYILHTYIHANIPTYIYTYIRSFIHVHMHVYMEHTGETECIAYVTQRTSCDISRQKLSAYMLAQVL